MAHDGIVLRTQSFHDVVVIVERENSGAFGVGFVAEWIDENAAVWAGKEEAKKQAK